MKYLTKRQVLAMQSRLVELFGGTAGIRDEGLLDSALNAPLQSFDGIDVFPSVKQKAARLCFGLVKNHAFVDGNKRIGAHAMLVLLELNHIELAYNDDDLIEVILAVVLRHSDFATNYKAKIGRKTTRL